MASTTVGVKRKSPPSPAKPPNQAAAATGPPPGLLLDCRGIAHTDNEEWANKYKGSVGPNRLVDALHAKTVL